jgi:hypothetical protein
MTLSRIVLVVSAALVAACSESGDNPLAPADFAPCRVGEKLRERHGTSCLCCHNGEFGVAGSVAHDAGVSTIFVSDAEGRTASMFPNIFDNFFQHRQLTPPLTPMIIFDNGEVRTMKQKAPHGSCNACHGETIRPLGER